MTSTWYVYCREWFIRGAWMNDVSVDVVWEFVKRKGHTQGHVKTWWNNPKNTRKWNPKYWPYDVLLNSDSEPDNWDISVCYRAIVNYKPIGIEEKCDIEANNIDLRRLERQHVQNQRSALFCLKALRNDLFHRKPCEISKEDYDRMEKLSKECYEKLLESEVEKFKQKLDKDATNRESVIADI